MDLGKAILKLRRDVAQWIAPKGGPVPAPDIGDPEFSTDGDEHTLSELPKAEPWGTPPAFHASAAPSLAEAAKRYAATRRNDPFPEIAPALLNSADIHDYIVQAGMVWPYRPEPKRLVPNGKKHERLKSASYAMSIGEEIAYWPPEAAEVSTNPVRSLGPRETFSIPSNSLVYVQTDEYLFLPDYIAVRLNLHIDLVHKGLLLGTGPIVDPGFAGKLVVPLHNLTNNTYVLAKGDDFIWVEFTKTSDLGEWRKWAGEADALGRSGTFKELPDRKIDKPLSHYLNKAREGHLRFQPGFIHPGLQNAVPEAIDEARKIAAQAALDAMRASQNVGRIAGWGVGIGAISVLAILIGFGEVLQSTLEMGGETNKKVSEVNERLGDVSRCVKLLDAAAAEKAGKPSQPVPPGEPAGPLPRPCANLSLDP